MRILLVEDDELITRPLVKALSNQRYTVDVATDGQAGWDLVQSFSFDLILLDVGLPKLDGLNLCRRLRSHGNLTPILLLTALDTSTAKVMGLDAGADDYLTKPFDLQELSARIRALLRRGSSALPPVLRWSNLQLDPSTCEVICNQQTLHLTPKEYELLELFLRNPHRIFSCGVLIDHLWSFEEPPGEDTVRSHIKGLRQKLKVAGIVDDPIETVYGIGYRLKPEIWQKKPEIIDEQLPSSSDLRRSETPAQPELVQTIETDMSVIWRQIEPVLNQRLLVIEQAVAAMLLDDLNPALRQKAVQEAHRLVGSLGMFGSEHGSSLAREIEQHLQEQDGLPQNHGRLLSRHTKALRQELQKLSSVEASGQRLETVLLMERAAVAQPPSNTAKIMVVDDDPHVLAVLRSLLVPWGFEVAPLTDPLKFFKVLEVDPPDLVILDVEIPPVSGIELCQAVRNDSRWSALPILFLTAHKDASIVHEVFAAGADDFISKPLVGPELITRVLNRLERTRLLRSLAEVDPVTGVNYRRRAMQELTRLLQECNNARADLSVGDQQQPFCFAIVELEDLKQINRQHGHAAGDQVLSRFGELLRRLFHDPKDVVGRWGGTEFVVGMAGMTKQEGEQRLSQLLRRFHQVAFTDAHGDLFQVLAHAGLVEHPQDGTDLEALYWAADAVLHQAKSAEDGSAKSALHV
jgi:diguanylate cyclase (GGDEF)-like protein